MPKITIINQPLYNRGDQAAHKALIRLLKEQDGIDITVLSIEKEKAVNLFAEGIEGVEYITFPPFRKKMYKFFKRVMHCPAFVLRLLELIPEIRRYNRIIRKSDYVLCSPGGICMGGYQNWAHIWSIANALSLKKRTGIYGRSIGPFYDRKFSEKVFTRRSIDILKKVDYLSLRDQYSQAIAKELAVDCVPTIDTAFAYKADCDIPKALSHLENRSYAVFVPNQLNAWHPYFTKVHQKVFDELYKSIIKDVLSRGFDVVMLPQLFGMKRVDGQYFRKLSEGFDAEKVFVIPDIYDSDIQQKIISRCSFMIGARYHSIIFAINNNVPFLCLSYEHKMQGTLKLLGLEAYSLTIKELLEQNNGIEKVTALLDSILNERSFVLSRIQQASLKAETIAKDAFFEFLSTLNRTNDREPEKSSLCTC